MTKLTYLRLHTRLARGLVLATLATVVLASPALAGPRVVGQSIVISSEPGSIVLAAAPGVSKASYDWTIAGKALGFLKTAKPGVSAQAAVSPVNMADPPSKQICPPGGSCGPLTAYFNTNVTWGCDIFGCSADFNGDAHVRWLGSTPFNADVIWQTDTLKAIGCGISFGGGGPGFSGSGDTASWSSPAVPNNWAIDHGYTSVHFQTPCAFFQFTQTTQVNVQFGANFFESFNRNGFS